MKILLTFIGGVGVQELIILPIILVVSIAVFLAMRALVLWYWKIEKIVDNQQIQIRLLQDLINELIKQPLIGKVVI